MPASTYRPAGAADILTIGFGTAAAMWAVGYFCRLFGPAVPAPLLFALLLACLVAGGFLLGRYSTRDAVGGLWAGLLTGVIDLLVVGSLMGGQTPHEIKSGALLWIPGTLVVCAALGGVGAALGRPPPANRAAPPHWPGLLAVVAACTTVVLLAAGGLVTGFDEGLAVVDWPNTEGYNMFLYPLSRMTGGVYLEHSHRLLGALVGLTTLVLAIHVQRTEPDRRLRRLAWLALLMVAVQGVLGGLRVTGRLTLSSQPADTAPSVVLAIVHGVFGQLVLAALVALAVCRSRGWGMVAPRIRAASVGTDRILGLILLVLLVGQLVLGALARHFTWALDILRYGLNVDPARLAAIGRWALNVHLAVAVVVILFAVAVGIRAWGLYPQVPILRRLGASLLVLIAAQLALGIAAFIVVGNDAPQRRPDSLDVAITTAHQVVGATLLAWAVMLMLWNYRWLSATGAVAGCGASSPADDLRSVSSSSSAPPSAT
jgi:cytochrome c oxidase assembly protein subunit 15